MMTIHTLLPSTAITKVGMDHSSSAALVPGNNGLRRGNNGSRLHAASSTNSHIKWRFIILPHQRWRQGRKWRSLVRLQWLVFLCTLYSWIPTAEIMRTQITAIMTIRMPTKNKDPMLIDNNAHHLILLETTIKEITFTERSKPSRPQV